MPLLLMQQQQQQQQQQQPRVMLHNSRLIDCTKESTLAKRLAGLGVAVADGDFLFPGLCRYPKKAHETELRHGALGLMAKGKLQTERFQEAVSSP